MSILSADGITFDIEVPVVIVGAGAAGLVAALSARELGQEVLVLERDAVPRGSTALSAGLIPAPGTRWQEAAGIADSPELFGRDIVAKASGEPDPDLVRMVAEAVGPTIEWLADRHGLPFSVIEDFRYPGHSVCRMHGLPSRSGGELIDRLRDAAAQAGVDILCDAHVTDLFAGADGRISGVAVERPDGSKELIGCGSLILACNGYGGNKDLVRRHIPELGTALYFGHEGNQGDALLWGQALGAAARHLSGHQGHGSVAHPHGILITWATITEGGFQVNLRGERFSDESHGYSEQAAVVLRQPEGLAWTVFDARIAGIARQFEDFRQAESLGAILTSETIEDLAQQMGVPADALQSTVQEVDALKHSGAADRFGRSFAGSPPLKAPYCAVKVTGALFHTQGGLVVDRDARVMREDGTSLPNLYAVGGAACGVSGSTAEGYLSGNGLLSAVALGRIAGLASGQAAARGMATP
ncbi:FAD-dependent oxidoreductase [Microvirga subterranea]|uniref:Fumarate reductase flavoprotein subunit n=1 Tax=Microvirga subterranea TaxID=186651 RepID=A0A370HD88_9HYPH|nr:FAD-dependent oxidoreductase [Microvirga subterranea]RDI54876.1 fumarate reductase flavoprotein subunit [Microvirga subterranea]